MVSHTKSCNLDYTGKWSYSVQFHTTESTVGLHEQKPLKRIRENPLLIFWSIYKTGTQPKTKHSKDMSTTR